MHTAGNIYIATLHKFSFQFPIHPRLPVKYGGIGIRSCGDLATPAFLSSIHSTKSLVGLILKSNAIKIAYLEDSLLACKSISLSLLSPEHPEYQSNWDLTIIKYKMERISTSSDIDSARMLVLQRPESGAWLHALPSKYLGTLLDKTSLRIAISLQWYNLQTISLCVRIDSKRQCD